MEKSDQEKSEVWRERVELVKVFRAAIKDNVNERNFFIKNYITVMLACVAGYGFIVFRYYDHNFSSWAASLVSLIGCAVCVLWSLHMETYRLLLRARYKTLNRIEEGLSISPHKIELQERNKLKENRAKKIPEKGYGWGPKLFPFHVPINNSDFLIFIPLPFLIIFLLMLVVSVVVVPGGV